MSPGEDLIWPWRESVRPESGDFDLMLPGWESVRPGIDLMLLGKE